VRWPSTKVVPALAAALLFAVALAGIVYKFTQQRVLLREHAAAVTGGDPVRGEALFIEYGCGSCHRVENVRTAAGMVGPPLDGIAERVIIGGHLANTPDNMQKWIRDPQHFAPGTAMPDLHVGADDARDIAAFLYTRGN